MRLGIRIVVRDVRPRVRFGDAEIGEHQRETLRAHRRAAVGVEGELARLDVFPFTYFGDELRGKCRGLAIGNHPPHDVPTIDVEHDVEVVVIPFLGTFKLRDVPTPQLIRRSRQQLGSRVARMAKLITAIADLLVFIQDAIHRSRCAEISSFVEKRRVHLGRCLFAKAWLEQRLQHDPAFHRCQCAQRRSSAPRTVPRSKCSVVSRPRHYQRAAHGSYPALGRVHRYRFHEDLSSSSGIGLPKSAATFFWISMSANACSSFFSSCTTRRRSCSASFADGSTTFDF